MRRPSAELEAEAATVAAEEAEVDAIDAAASETIAPVLGSAEWLERLWHAGATMDRGPGDGAP